MSDKKVERHVRSSESERPLSPTDKLQESLSDEGVVVPSQPHKSKGKTELLDKFREREERLRREQGIGQRGEEPGEPGEPAGEG